ncbi:uncharacterized protein LOC109795459 isoform X2 [Cajanus cajan]|uniref:uncharacterized protein LOC109795459 isoform X2 n=1 Tax=Cajanus cajan TaxID=3821 RepID=UPI0010FAD815|nr:uncharacterized protein LOC109795459 isoform X2 [Cajanus cajan]
MNMHKAYLVVMTLELACIGIKYGGGVSETNPFQPSTPTPTVMLFLTAMFSHVLASTADITNQTIIITFHVSGIIGCEALLQILLVHFLWYSIINLILLLLASLCFFNYITHLLTCFFNCITPSNADPMPNMELKQPQAQLQKEYQ